MELGKSQTLKLLKSVLDSSMGVGVKYQPTKSPWLLTQGFGVEEKGGKGCEVRVLGEGESKNPFRFSRKNGRSKSLLVISICVRKLDNNPLVFFGLDTWISLCQIRFTLGPIEVYLVKLDSRIKSNWNTSSRSFTLLQLAKISMKFHTKIKFLGQIRFKLTSIEMILVVLVYTKANWNTSRLSSPSKLQRLWGNCTWRIFFLISWRICNAYIGKISQLFKSFCYVFIQQEILVTLNIIKSRNVEWWPQSVYGCLGFS